MGIKCTPRCKMKSNTLPPIHIFCLLQCSSMPVLQLYPPANPLALSLDHDYLPRTMEEDFLLKERVSSGYSFGETLKCEKKG